MTEGSVVVTQALQEALEVHDAAVKPCPYTKSVTPDSRQDCKLCGASSNEPCRKRVIADAEFVNAVRAIASRPADREGEEPFGYWVEQKGAEPALFRKPAYIPEPSALRTVTPLYLSTHPAGDRMREALEWLAEQKTVAEALASGKTEWADASVERRIEMIGERKDKHDKAVLAARAALKDQSHVR